MKNFYKFGIVDLFMYALLFIIITAFLPFNIFSIITIPSAYISNNTLKPIVYSTISKDEIYNSKELPPYRIDTLQELCWSRLTQAAKDEFGINHKFDISVLIISENEGYCVANISKFNDHYYQNAIKTLK